MVTASGNSAKLFSLGKVTFLTSKILLSQRKSNLVSLENLNSGLIFLTDLNSEEIKIEKKINIIDE